MVMAVALRALQQSPLQTLFDAISARHLQPHLPAMISSDRRAEFDFSTGCKHGDLHTRSIEPRVPLRRRLFVLSRHPRTTRAKQLRTLRVKSHGVGHAILEMDFAHVLPAGGRCQVAMSGYILHGHGCQKGKLTRHAARHNECC
jgi:hypothetical protein